MKHDTRLRRNLFLVVIRATVNRKGTTMNAFLSRLREPSTYAGVSVLLGVFGVNVAPEIMQPAVQVITGLAALAAVVLREGKR